MRFLVRRALVILWALVAAVTWCRAESVVNLSAFTGADHYGLYSKFEWKSETTILVLNLTDNWPDGTDHYFDVTIDPDNGPLQTHRFQWSGPGGPSGGQSHTFTIDPGASSVAVTMQYGGSGTLTSVSPPEETKKVRISYFNDKQYSVDWRLVDAANPETVLAAGTLGPRSGLVGTYELPEGVDAVEFVVSVDGVGMDGPSWVVQEDAVTTVKSSPIAGTSTGPGVDPPTTEIPSFEGLPDVSDLPSVETPPTAPPKAPVRGAPIWYPSDDTSDDERLDKATYRQGVDAIIQTLQGDGTHEEPDEVPLFEFTPPEGLPAASYSKVPEASPGVFEGTMGSAHELSVTVPGITIGSVSLPEYTWTFDFSPYASVISLVRGVELFVMTLGFFILCVRAIRGSSASEQ